MTKERFEQIKSLWETDKDKCNWGHVGELLYEVAALKATLKSVQAFDEESGAVSNLPLDLRRIIKEVLNDTH